MIDIAEQVAKLNEIIRIQKEVIDELFHIVLQYITPEEADNLPVVKRINLAADIRRDYKLDEEEI